MSGNIVKPTVGETYVWGVVLLLIPFVSLLLATTTFLLGGVVGAWMFPTAVLVSVVAGACYVGKFVSRSHAMLRYGIFVVVSLVVTLLTATVLYDHSYDGNTYHQGGIIHMLHGWNPVKDPAMPSSPWERHYAKALEIVAATITVCFGRIECGKAVNLMLILASMLITRAFLSNTFRHFSSRKVWLYTLLLALCPIVICQSCIYYNDYPLYTFMLLAVIALVTLYRNAHDKLAWVMLFVVIIMAASTKFTIAFYLYLTLAVGIVWIFFKGKRALSYRLVALSAVLLILGLGVVGYHPYVTNTIGWGNPFYPLIGGEVDIMSSNTPEIYHDGNRVTNLVRSLFYNEQGTGVWVPLVSDSLHDYYIAYDNRIAGFGPLFVYALMAAILLVAWVYVGKRDSLGRPRYDKSCFILILLLVAGCFIFEQSWWMRYVPFLWAVPVVMLLVTEQWQLARMQRMLRKAVFATLLFTQLMCVVSTTFSGVAYTQRLGGVLHAITPQSKVEVYSVETIQSFNHKMQERGIDFEILGEGEMPSDSTMRCVEFHSKACIYVDEATYMRMTHPDLLDLIDSKK